jgi:hypothetical protein
MHAVASLSGFLTSATSISTQFNTIQQQFKQFNTIQHKFKTIQNNSRVTHRLGAHPAGHVWPRRRHERRELHQVRRPLLQAAFVRFAPRPVSTPKQTLVWDSIKPASTFAFNFNKTIYYNTILVVTTRV